MYNNPGSINAMSPEVDDPTSPKTCPMFFHKDS